MLREDVIKLQTAVGAKPDGDFGKLTLQAVFMKLGCKKAKALTYATAAISYMKDNGFLDSPARLCQFMAQLAHESGGFVYDQEIASGKAYEGRKDLGNIYPGDGVRFKGRGPIQLTGRENYRIVGERLGIDLENNPELAAKPEIGILIACDFFLNKGLLKLADLPQVYPAEANKKVGSPIRSITIKVNGGYNGFEDRVRYYNICTKWFM